MDIEQIVEEIEAQYQATFGVQRDEEPLTCLGIAVQRHWKQLRSALTAATGAGGDPLVREVVDAYRAFLELQMQCKNPSTNRLLQAAYALACREPSAPAPEDAALVCRTELTPELQAALERDRSPISPAPPAAARYEPDEDARWLKETCESATRSWSAFTDGTVRDRVARVLSALSASEARGREMRDALTSERRLRQQAEVERDSALGWLSQARAAASARGKEAGRG
jgi:hypothetical protein